MRRLLPCCALACGLLAPAGVLAEEPAAGSASSASAVKPIDKGLRVFSAGHSFHMFVPNLLRELAQAASIDGHAQAGTQSLGGSRVIQHWDLPEERNKARAALAAGNVDVLTLSPIYLPDEGIENFARLALEHNPHVRITIQEFWLPYDVYQTDYQKRRPQAVDRNSRTAEQLRSLHAEYFRSMDQHLAALNSKLGRPVLSVVPAGQAVIALREKIIAGEAPGLKSQDELFRDAIGHATPPLQALVGYCHYAVIYRRSPVGLPMAGILKNAKNPESDELNRLLQELAWQAALEHPLSGVSGQTSAASGQ
jgi:hypothetical protein